MSCCPCLVFLLYSISLLTSDPRAPTGASCQLTLVVSRDHRRAAVFSVQTHSPGSSEPAQVEHSVECKVTHSVCVCVPNMRYSSSSSSLTRGWYDLFSSSAVLISDGVPLAWSAVLISDGVLLAWSAVLFLYS